MNAEELNVELQELIVEIFNLSNDQQKQLGELITKAKHQHGDSKESVDEVAESLGNLRICIKYLIFDLEATKRERDSLKKMLKDKQEDDDRPNKAEGEM